MSYNKDELEAPDWVNSDFFKLVLMNSEKCTNIKIIDYQITPATIVGDHFASIMFRAKINYSENDNSNANISLIIKTAPFVEGIKKDMLSNVDLFETEIYMYTKVLPISAAIIKSCGVEDLLAPRLLYQAIEPHKVVVFEDLKELGYFMYPTNVASEDDFKLIFAKLAQLHASTFKMAADGNTEITQVKGSCFSIPDLKNMTIFTTGTELLLKTIETIPELALCAEKLRKFKEHALLDKCIESVTVPGSYNVLNHGDYHIRNMMFKNNDDNNISEVVLIDFQICHWGSPANDLLYMSTIVPYEMREEIYNCYFKNFIEILQKSGFSGKLPTYEQFQDELQKFRHIELFMVSTFLPFMLFEKDKIDFELEDIMTEKFSKISFYENEKYIKIIKQLLPIYLEKGYFDDIIQ